MLKINNLYAKIGEKEILKGVSLNINRGEIHALMGPNGSGKSTLATTLIGNPLITVTKGSVSLDGKDLFRQKQTCLLNLDATARARLGLFLAFQYPVEVPGVSLESFLRLSYGSIAGINLPPIKFRTLLMSHLERLGMAKEFTERNLNEGASGGEKKKGEILQMAVLNPKYAILDEIDSGLDIGAQKTIFEKIKTFKNTGVVIITHYPRILKILKPDFVHVMINGTIVQSGNSKLAEEIENNGYHI
ncbi:Fe-S cluster assembly ATPase SufC [Candidatus Parcubacteria bacterium]|nr:Fe-S cluster assembly ATPase SufC [Patescibacteria group bacterium]MBU4381099.1 Fe-S cluster assembly ATPase SufC [Patescibacteria group bacterium]MCG2689178.1 Fe-S cluster assembly ATPase SufC [Candidatus Parcubacteria bacterium]